MLDVQKYLFFVINVQKQHVSGNIVDTYNMKILQMYTTCVIVKILQTDI